MIFFYKHYPYSLLATLLSALANVFGVGLAVGGIAMIASGLKDFGMILGGVVMIALAVFCFVYVGRKLTDKLVEQNLSVRAAENMARLLSGSKKKEPSTTKTPQPKSYKTVARTLSDTLGTDVKIKTVSGKSKIEIQFKDETDLERLFRIITNNN